MKKRQAIKHKTLKHYPHIDASIFKFSSRGMSRNQNFYYIDTIACFELWNEVSRLFLLSETTGIETLTLTLDPMLGNRFGNFQWMYRLIHECVRVLFANVSISCDHFSSYFDNWKRKMIQEKIHSTVKWCKAKWWTWFIMEFPFHWNNHNYYFTTVNPAWLSTQLTFVQ